MDKDTRQIHLRKIGGRLTQTRCGRTVSSKQIVGTDLFEYIYPSFRCSECSIIYERIKAKGFS